MYNKNKALENKKAFKKNNKKPIDPFSYEFVSRNIRAYLSILKKNCHRIIIYMYTNNTYDTCHRTYKEIKLTKQKEEIIASREKNKQIKEYIID